MSRKKISTEIKTQVLIQCRRRCCICFGLERDDNIKKGQIAHINGDRNDNRLDNLAFLCLEHHDQFDSKTSQSKNLTTNEVREFRKELHNEIDEIWKKPLNVGNEDYSEIKRLISGRYIREGFNEQAEFQIINLGKDRIKVSGLSFWGIKNEYGPNIGQLDFESDLLKNATVYSQKSGDDLYRIFIEFNGDKIIVKEDYVIGFFGMNVTFEGEYMRAE
ncbi:MAG: hypothetical protein WBA61_16220 [Aequorivita sp.]